jgi:hypothetical protein
MPVEIEVLGVVGVGRVEAEDDVALPRSARIDTRTPEGPPSLWQPCEI